MRHVDSTSGLSRRNELRSTLFLDIQLAANERIRAVVGTWSGVIPLSRDSKHHFAVPTMASPPTTMCIGYWQVRESAGPDSSCSNAGTSRGLVRTQTTCCWVACVRRALVADVHHAQRRWNNAWSTFLSMSQVLYGQSCLLNACMHRFAGCVPIPVPLGGTCAYTKI